jgi:hypothetical protein
MRWIAAWSAMESHIADISHVIQLAVAPVFL